MIACSRRAASDQPNVGRACIRSAHSEAPAPSDAALFAPDALLDLAGAPSAQWSRLCGHALHPIAAGAGLGLESRAAASVAIIHATHSTLAVLARVVLFLMTLLGHRLVVLDLLASCQRYGDHFFCVVAASAWGSSILRAANLPANRPAALARAGSLARRSTTAWRAVKSRFASPIA